jgi:hypothetical protein
MLFAHDTAIDQADILSRIMAFKLARYPSPPSMRRLEEMGTAVAT